MDNAESQGNVAQMTNISSSQMNRDPAPIDLVYDERPRFLSEMVNKLFDLCLEILRNTIKFVGHEVSLQT